VSSNMIPFPELTAQIAQAGFGLAMPVAAADEESDMALNFALRGLEISDMIWGMVDPAGQLPRDPANIALDLTGSGRWFVDIFDPQVAENLTGLPGQVSAVQINDLEVSAAGAALTGEGAFTFDFTDFTTFPGSPRPAGSVNLELVGINGLMDTLVSMGLLPQEQVMGARMMMGIFATPGEGEDTLKSELTVTDDGQVLANGQRLR